MMLCESKAQKESQICVKVACTVLCTRLLLVLVKIKMKTSDMEHMEDYTQCDNRTKVVGTKYTGERMVPELGEVSARDVKKLTEMRINHY